MKRHKTKTKERKINNREKDQIFVLPNKHKHKTTNRQQ